MRQANVNGKGAIFQVSDTKWIAKICLGVDENGKPIIKQFSGKTEAIAKQKLRDFQKSRDYSKRHLLSDTSVKAYFTTWLKEYQFHKLKPSSYDRLENMKMALVFFVCVRGALVSLFL